MHYGKARIEMGKKRLLALAALLEIVPEERVRPFGEAR